jgi:hypothetical protein
MNEYSNVLKNKTNGLEYSLNLGSEKITHKIWKKTIELIFNNIFRAFNNVD